MQDLEPSRTPSRDPPHSLCSGGGTKVDMSTRVPARCHRRTICVSSLLAAAQPMSQWFSGDFLQQISEKSEALCFALRLQLSLHWKEVVECELEKWVSSTNPSGIAHARLVFFMALNGFFLFKPAPLYLYPVFVLINQYGKLGERHSICGFLWVYMCHNVLFSYQVDVTK